MARVVGIDHLVISVSDFERSKAFYDKVLGALRFKLKHEYSDMAGWSNGKTLFWISQADAEGKKHPHRKGNIGFHHYAFELSKRADVDAVYFLDPDGLRMEAMVFDPKGLKAAKKKEKAGKKRKKG
jgi:catechol 2,3-dioxygenase-like lactoylglutathione lyase family enzyme